ncbi:putative transmembrane protein [Thalictrum thalictroides]|uniref:Putative transmembrane protein n=1 Tax=Thalictrum thalictroides TaxID=46969 RepID=A0A7J6V5E6_THATH|nr:putative transmembrane protein [Thalictrum thalictroides]
MAPVITRTSMSNFDQIQWVVQIRRTLEEELEDEDIPVCIFNVPKALMSSKPEVYIPQQVAIGPYHYWRQELYEMERYKVAAAKRTQKRLHTLNFHHLVDQLTKLEPRIRGCYHKYLDFNGETLAWMMAVDLSFLLEYLQTYVIKEGKRLTRVSSRMSHLVDSAGRKSAHNAILRDIVMLENQVPLFVLRKILEFEHSSLELADELLFSMLIGLCRELLPFNIVDIPCIEISDIAHLLDFLYQVMVPKSEIPPEIIEEEGGQNKTLEREGSSKHNYVRDFFHEMWKLLSKLNRGPVSYIKKVLLSRPLMLVAKLPWTIVSRLPIFALLKQPLKYFFFHQDKEDVKPEDPTTINKPPLVEEIMIPSVTELYKSGVRFVPSSADIKNISFDPKTFTFHLPTISLDVNTEVVLRNLVAYEASTASGTLVFTRYTELMNGIIDTEEDVKVLREKGIVLNYMKSDGEVADLWNGMSKSVRLTRVPCLDKVIEDVNKYYSGRWKIKIRSFVRTYVFGSWKFLTFLAAIFLLLLMTLQAFCSVYTCSRFFNLTPASSSTS